MNKTIYKTGNAVEALLNGEINHLIHVCNDKGVMASGIASEIREKIPTAFRAYIESGYELGSVSDNGQGVWNMVAQKGYGYDGKKYLNYGALGDCLSDVDSSVSFGSGFNNLHRIKIGLPYKMGSDRAGGDWEVVLEMVEWHLKDFQIVVYKLEED